MHTLRPYQSRAVAMVLSRLAHNPILVAPTGSGKTVMGCAMVRAFANQNKKVLWLAHRKELIEQAAATLAPYCNYLTGIIMAGYPEAPMASVQVASVQTLIRRSLPDADLIIVDEAHHATADAYTTIVKGYPDTPRIGLTATPFRLDGRGLGDVFGDLVVAAYTDDLCATGVLHSPKVYAGHSPDLRGVKKSMGDYVTSALVDRMNQKGLVGDIVETWRAKANGKKTVAFAVNVDHSKHIVDQFTEAGIRAEHIDANTPKAERAGVLARLRSGDTQVVSNCMILTEGWDLPALECAIIARPTASLNLHCLDESTEILTRDGWKTHDLFDFTRDEVATWHNEVIEFEKPLAFLRKAVDSQNFYQIKSARMNFRVTEHHRMVMRAVKFNRTKCDPKFIPIEDLARKAANFDLPVSGLEQSTGVLLSDDELRFVGWVMTDGSINIRSRQIQIYQSARYPKNLEEIRRVLDSCGFKWREGIQPKTGQYKSPHNVHAFRVSFGKPRGCGVEGLRGCWSLLPFISKDFSQALYPINEDQFNVLLHAIHLGDGSKQTNTSWVKRSYSISSGNKVFIERLQSLAIRRRWAANLSVHINRYGNPIYMLHMKKQCWRSVGGRIQTDRKSITKEVASGIAWCVETSKGTIITRRMGKPLVTGNCQMLGRIMRAADGKDGCIVLDHAGNHHMHGLVTRRLEYSLNGKLAGEKDPLGLRRCGACQLLFDPKLDACPECGWMPPKQETNIPQGVGVLGEFQEDFTYRREMYRLWVSQAEDAGFKQGWVLYRYKERFRQWPVTAFGDLVDPDNALPEEKKECYRHWAAFAAERGFKSGWAGHQYKNFFGVWPSGFVSEVREELGISSAAVDRANRLLAGVGAGNQVITEGEDDEWLF